MENLMYLQWRKKTANVSTTLQDAFEAGQADGKAELESFNRRLLERVEKLKYDRAEYMAANDVYLAALEKLSVCGGGCEGPLGCCCKAPIARKAIAQVRDYPETK